MHYNNSNFLTINIMIDLHFHSKLSDGRKTNEEIIQEIKEKWLLFAACTDHDYINSDFTKIALANWIGSVEWVEISWVDDAIGKHLHLTCYSRQFKWRIIDILDASRSMKQEKIKLQIDLLVSNWFTINFQEFYNYFEAKGIKMDNLNSWHIATYIFKFPENLALIATMTWDKITTWSFIRRFLKREWDFWFIWSITLPEYEPNIAQLWELARENTAILSVAHPNFKLTINQFKTRIESYLNDWVNAIEINSKARPERVKLILEYKQKYNFLLTFWSDCHFKTFKEDVHWFLWEINPLVDNELLQKSFNEFRQKLGV